MHLFCSIQSSKLWPVSWLIPKWNWHRCPWPAHLLCGTSLCHPSTFPAPREVNRTRWGGMHVPTKGLWLQWHKLRDSLVIGYIPSPDSSLSHNCKIQPIVNPESIFKTASTGSDGHTLFLLLLQASHPVLSILGKFGPTPWFFKHQSNISKLSKQYWLHDK